MTAEKILAIARGEIGNKESPANSNRVKYNTAYYGKEVSGSNYAWCAAFVWWVFWKAGASALFYGGKKTAYCPTLKNYHKGQAVKGDYRPGDVIFFNFNGGSNAAHVGICESWDGTYITTIDGNTAPTNEANGGAVMRRRRAKRYIVGAYRPGYQGQVKPDAPTSGVTEERKAAGVAKALDKSLAGTYVVTAGNGLHIRSGAGAGKASMAVLPKGTRVRNYGYYTEVSGVAWLYVQATHRGVRYTGFCSGQYLSKV